jgi:hypothetical protein
MKKSPRMNLTQFKPFTNPRAAKQARDAPYNNYVSWHADNNVCKLKLASGANNQPEEGTGTRISLGGHRKATVR